MGTIPKNSRYVKMTHFSGNMLEWSVAPINNYGDDWGMVNMAASFTHGDFTRVRQTTMILRVYSKGSVSYTLWLFNI